MNFTNVFLIFRREVRDQLRDRRMLFMMFILPLLLYPLMGISAMQLTQFLKAHVARVLVIGAPDLREYPPLLKSEAFNPEWMKDLSEFELRLEPLPPGATELPANMIDEARRRVNDEEYDVVVAFPPAFAAELQAFHQWLLANREGSAAPAVPQPRPPRVFCNTARQKSDLALRHVNTALRRWQDAISKRNLTDTQYPLAALQPFEFEQVELAQPEQKSAAAWSRILPMMLILWALTGAFYPAIDLCAGEKERGTLETLLCSPAEREEIVSGKMLTVMLFSMGTSLLNLLSIGVTGIFVIKQLKSIAPAAELGIPPLASMGWLALGLIPVAVLFSALCVALASFARSSKEGQFYMMPLMMTVIPLALLPMNPQMELTMGNALIPISGLILVLRHLLEGEILKTLPYLIPVGIVTGLCCWMAVRWAVDQFNREEVLFRESERFNLRLWLASWFQDRNPTPNVALGLACALLILVIEFFFSLSMSTEPTSTAGIVQLVLISQLVIFATPTLLMAVMLTTNPLRTLGLQPTRWMAVVLAGLLAVVLHPATNLLGKVLTELYPISPEAAAKMSGIQKFIMGDGVPPWLPYLIIAILPAICEELTFRGFILSGLRHWGSRRRAIFVSAFFFGIAHMMLQQSLNAMIMGVVLGYLAVKSGSIFPCMVFHAINNGLQIFVGKAIRDRETWVDWMVQRSADEQTQFLPSLIVIGLLAGGVILAWFGRLPLTRTREESVWDSIKENRHLEMT